VAGDEALGPAATHSHHVSFRCFVTAMAELVDGHAAMPPQVAPQAPMCGMGAGRWDFVGHAETSRDWLPKLLQYLKIPVCSQTLDPRSQTPNPKPKPSPETLNISEPSHTAVLTLTRGHHPSGGYQDHDYEAGMGDQFYPHNRRAGG